MSEEKRLLDDPSLDPELARALRAGRDEAPSPDRLAAIAAALPTLPPGGGGGGGGGTSGAGAGGGSVAPVAGGLPFAAKALLAVGALAGAIAGGVVAFGGPSPTPSTTLSTTLVPSASAPFASAVATETAAPSASIAPTVALRPIPRPSASALVVAPDPSRDEGLVDEASRAVTSQPDVALAKCAEHARLFPKSVLAEERDRLEVEALVHLHRDAEARSRAAAFAARYPGSAYQRRIDALFAD